MSDARAAPRQPLEAGPTIGRLIHTALNDALVVRWHGDMEVLVSDLAIYDPQVTAPIGVGELLLVPGPVSVEELEHVAERAKAAGAAGLLIRDEGQELGGLGLPTVSISVNVAWSAVYDGLRVSLGSARKRFGSDPTRDDGVADLFALANAVSSRINAAVLIEDREMHVIAFSAGQEDTDPSRVDTILRRRASEAFKRHFNASGLHDKLYRGEHPIYLEREVQLDKEGLSSSVYSGSNPSYTERRAAVGIRAGDRELGAIWAVVRSPLSPDVANDLVEAAKVAALHVLRHEATVTRALQRKADVFRTLLWGGHGVAAAWQELGLRRGLRYGVVTTARTDEQPFADREAADVAGALESYFNVHSVACAFCAIEGRVVGIVTMRSGRANSADTVKRLATSYAAQPGNRTMSTGISEPVGDAAGLVVARQQAENALLVAVVNGSEPRVAKFADVQAAALMATIARSPDLIGPFVPSPPIRALVAHDARTGSDLVGTLRTFLASLGSVSDTADKLHVHMNTLRHRINRINDISGLDFSAEHTVAELSLQLYLLDRLPYLSRPGPDQE